MESLVALHRNINTQNQLVYLISRKNIGLHTCVYEIDKLDNQIILIINSTIYVCEILLVVI